MLDATAAAEERHFWFLHLRRTARSLLTSALAGIEPRLIVDCGAGTGRNLEWLSGFGPAVGIERSPTGLAYGRKQQRRMLQGSVTHLPFADGAADVVTSFDVLYCLDDLEERQAVREMFRVLAFDVPLAKSYCVSLVAEAYTKIGAAADGATNVPGSLATMTPFGVVTVH